MTNDKMMNDELKIPILCYHRVHRDDDKNMPAVIDGQYCGHVTESIFRKQLRWLAENGFSTVKHCVLAKWLDGKVSLAGRKLVAIDFDDNRLNVFENAFPIMEELGFKATVFVISELANGNLPKMEQQFPAMNWEHLARLRNAGWCIGSHTATHQNLSELYRSNGGAEKVEWELAHSRKQIKQYLDIDAMNLAYPNGNWNEQVETIVKKYYRTARLWQNKFKACFNTKQTNPYRLVAMNISMQTSEDDFKKILFSL